MEITSLAEIYEVCIMRLIELNNIKESIPMIKNLLELYGDKENYGIVFCYQVLSIILNEMSDFHKKGLLKIAFYTFTTPLKLLEIV
jgi:hypothetical protein